MQIGTLSVSKDLYIYGSMSPPGTKTYISTKIEESPVPIHPHYAKMMNPELKIGDLVETCTGKIGLIKEYDAYPREGSMTIFGANNRYYKVMIGEEEKIYVGYSLKKI